MKRKLGFLMGLIVASVSTALAQRDSVFTDVEFLQYVGNYHPVLKQANLLSGFGEANVRKARGSFDPKLGGMLNQKEFDGTNYFNRIGMGLTVPTWFGVDVKAGFDQSDGVYLNRENKLPDNGLWYSGISVPLGQGLFIDKRRTAVKQAKLYKESTEFERAILLNDLYLESLTAYWKWVEAWNRYQVYAEYEVLAENRFQAVKQSYRLGDNPAIDTLESFIQLQNRQLLKNKAFLEFRQQGVKLSNYLWTEGGVPLTVTAQLKPPLLSQISFSQPLSDTVIERIIAALDTVHPKLLNYANKVQNKELELRLKKELLKPTVNAGYQFLTEPNGSPATSFSSQNYKWSLDVAFPIFLRKQRGEVQIKELEINDLDLTVSQEKLVLQNKVQNYHLEQVQLLAQLRGYRSMASNYERLLAAEREKFRIGESSLFLINTRENQLIKARLDLIEIQTKYQLAEILLEWSQGRLYL